MPSTATTEGTTSGNPNSRNNSERNRKLPFNANARATSIAGMTLNNADNNACQRLKNITLRI